MRNAVLSDTYNMKNLRFWVALLLLAFMMGGVAWLSGKGGGEGSAVGVSPSGAPAIDPASGAVALVPSKSFSLMDASGDGHSLSDYKGQALVLHFWATWCEPCVEEIPALMAFARSLEGKPFTLLLVSLDESWEQAWTVLPKQGLPSNVVSLIDPDSKVPELYGSYQFPESYLLDREQRITAKWVGMQKWSDPYFGQAVGKLIR